MGRTEELTARLVDTMFGPVEWVDSIGSTNAVLLDRARDGAAEGAVLIADHQTAGRGRRGRRWEDTAANALLMSVLLRPPPSLLPPSVAHLATLALAVSAADACAEVTAVEVAVKWPNDLVVEPPPGPAGADDPGYRKVAGVLTESLVVDGAVAVMVPGIGLNTGWPEIPDELAARAASLNLLSGGPVDRLELAAVTLTGLDARYRVLLADGPRRLLDETRTRSATLGRRVRVLLEGRTVSGTAADLDELGRLVVDTDDGARAVFDVGDVEHVRPV